FLLQAERLTPGDLHNRLELGLSRYRAHRYREAAQQLGALLDHPDLQAFGAQASEGLYRGALAERKLRRQDKALRMLEAAVRIDPTHLGALDALAEHAGKTGDLARVVELLDRRAAATPGAKERSARYQQLGELLLVEVKDLVRATDAFRRAVDAAGEEA